MTTKVVVTFLGIIQIDESRVKISFSASSQRFPHNQFFPHFLGGDYGFGVKKILGFIGQKFQRQQLWHDLAYF